ncbi:MAG: hypothetical protein U9R74_09475 [Pseudomonadota bacterium]|nr:hypothetical protein [Pseudomonadota bacterium]
MPDTPTRQQQIAQAHAHLIIGVVKATQNPELLPEIEQALKVTEQNGWTDLVAAIRRILAGQRDVSVLNTLDEEDAAIVEAILRGLQDPSTLPDPDQQADPTMAAPGLAGMIHQAGRGNAQALQVLAGMADQMTTVGGDMAMVGGIMKRLIDGERDADKLSKGMSASGRTLVFSILEELGKLEAH